ncbi:MAG: hypothetical protein ACTHLE_19615 [Agriterribacter sp.]
MKRYFSGLIALAVAIGAAAFTHEPLEKPGGPEFVDYYFQFTGTRDQDEGDRTKWTLLSTQTLAAYNALSCPGANYGCKMIATDTTLISGIIRPQSVHVQSGTFRPITGTDVSAVANTNTAP